MEGLFESFKGLKVLVTGGAGSVGSNLARKISESEAKEVIILDNLSSAYRWNIPRAENIRFVEGDILNDDVLRMVFKEKPDLVYHLAAHFANQNSVDNPELDLMVNGLGTLKLLQYSQLTDVNRFIYSSSSCGVYSKETKIPFEEHEISINLHTPYQVTKLLGELYTNYYQNLYNLPIVNARFFNVFGPGEVPGKYRNVIPNFFYWAIQGTALPITGDGSETRDWTFMDDIVNGLMLMGIREKAVGESINLGSGEEKSVITMAEKINNLTRNKAGIKIVGRRKWDVNSRRLSSIEKARKTIGYEPVTTFDDGLDQTHTWFINNYEKILRDAEF